VVVSDRGPCTIEVDGRKMQVWSGQSVAAALVSERVWLLRANQVSGEPRGPYCGMGVCFDCELEIDGVPAVRACLTDVRDGMIIRTDAQRAGATAHEL
jgi:predicted molibdopterin-dependent oxidoreductase YjgC